MEAEFEELALEHILSEHHTHINEQDRAFRKTYFKELFCLQTELIKLQYWVVETGHKVVISFDGRDADGKGSAIKRITQRLNPRVCRVAAFPALNERERTQWYFQRYVSHLQYPQKNCH